MHLAGRCTLRGLLVRPMNDYISNGTKCNQAEAMPLSHCSHLSKGRVTTGRQGTIVYQGALLSADNRIHRDRAAFSCTALLQNCVIVFQPCAGTIILPLKQQRWSQYSQVGVKQHPHHVRYVRGATRMPAINASQVLIGWRIARDRSRD